VNEEDTPGTREIEEWARENGLRGAMQPPAPPPPPDDNNSQDGDDEKRIRENEKKAREAADLLFPGEKWNQEPEYGERIYVSARRKIGNKTNFKDELYDAQILRDAGSTVYLVPEDNRRNEKQFDAIVDGLKFEFKDIGGNANTLEHQFLRSRSQAPNVFINLEKTGFTRREIMSTLYGARNKPGTGKIKGYAHYNRFNGGKIIIKIRNQGNLIYLNVDDLKI
jgi:hypothetical protein